MWKAKKAKERNSSSGCRIKNDAKANPLLRFFMQKWAFAGKWFRIAGKHPVTAGKRPTTAGKTRRTAGKSKLDTRFTNFPFLLKLWS